MSLLNNTTPTQKVDEATPATKHSNSEYQKKQRELLKQHGAVISAYIAKQKDVPADVQAAAAWFKQKAEGRVAGHGGKAMGKPAFYKIFGDTPKIGDKITALKVFESTGKGFSEMRSLMKKWETKQGITVSYDEKTKEYKIEKGDVKPYTEE